MGAHSQQCLAPTALGKCEVFAMVKEQAKSSMEPKPKVSSPAPRARNTLQKLLGEERLESLPPNSKLQKADMKGLDWIFSVPFSPLPCKQN